MVAKNRINDRSQAAYMEKAGWVLLRLWEHDLKLRPDWCADQIRQHVSLANTQLAANPASEPHAEAEVEVRLSTAHQVSD